MIDQGFDYLILDQRAYHLRFLPSVLQNETFFLDRWRRMFRKCWYTWAVMTFHILITTFILRKRNCNDACVDGIYEGILQHTRLNWSAKPHCFKTSKAVEHSLQQCPNATMQIFSKSQRTDKRCTLNPFCCYTNYIKWTYIQTRIRVYSHVSSSVGLYCINANTSMLPGSQWKC